VPSSDYNGTLHEKVYFSYISFYSQKWHGQRRSAESLAEDNLEIDRLTAAAVGYNTHSAALLAHGTLNKEDAHTHRQFSSVL